MKRFSSFGDDENTAGSSSMEEVSKKIRAAGSEEPKSRLDKLHDRRPDLKEKDESADPEKTDPGKEAAPNLDDPGKEGDKPATDDQVVAEPPEPQKKTDEEMNKSPEEYLNPSDDQTQMADEKKESVNQDVVGEMGGGSLNDVLKGAFSDFLDGKSKKSMEKLSAKIKNAGTNLSYPEYGVAKKGVYRGVKYQIEVTPNEDFFFYAGGKTDGYHYRSVRAAETAAKEFIDEMTR